MKKTNNKGFSLVELIVVIAIMAVLIAVLAPSFLRYVEKSRNSTDMQNAAAIVNAVQVWAVDAGLENSAAMLKPDTSYTVKVDKDGVTCGTEIDAALANAGLTKADIKLQSKTRTTDYTITFTVAKNGSMTVDYTPAWVGNPNTT